MSLDYQRKLAMDHAKLVKAVEELNKRVKALESERDRGGASDVPATPLERLEQLKGANAS